MEMTKKRIKLDTPTKEINVVVGRIRKAKQDRLGRVYIWIE